MLTPFHGQRGVTLIELMIGLTIFAVLMALAMPSFSAYVQNTKIRNVAESIQAGINLARAEAVRRNTAVQFVLGTGLAWTVECVTAIGDVDLNGVPDCPGSAPAATTPSSIQAKVSAERSTGVTVETSPTFTILGFSGVGRVLSTSLAAGASASIDIKNPPGGSCAVDGGTMRCLRVVVTSAGQVRMCDPKRAAPDPQACP